MASVQSFFAHLLCIVLIVSCINLSEAKLDKNHTNFSAFDFERVKNDLFANSDFSNPNKISLFSSQSSRQDNAKCLQELNAIQTGLKGSEFWAMKIVDAWGKTPASIFEGNLYDFGGFSECFHIERNNEHYDTQYCLGNLILDFKLPTSRSNQFPYRNVPMPNILQMDSTPAVQPRMGVPTASSGSAITFGVCMPASCSSEVVEEFVNNIISQNVEKVSIKLPGNTCQFEENPSGLETLDIVTIVLFSVVLCLAVASTSYDILFTVMNWPKLELFLAFSFYTNGRKLLSYKRTKSPDMMDCLHGIRVISTQWVVLGHTFMMYVMLPIRNKLVIADFPKSYHNMVLMSAFISVDTFFVLSGLLVSISMLKHLEKTKGKMNIPMVYLHRYLRLTPLLGAAFLFSMTLLRFFGSGPLWPNMMSNLSKQCERHWWTALLYVQNYVNPDDICFGHSWYLSVDMQLFWIAPLLVYLIYFFKGKALFAMSFAVMGCIGCTLSTYITNDLAGFLKADKMKLTYYPTHIRFSPWLIGLMAGALFFEARKKSIRIPPMFNLFAWALSLVTMATVIFGNYPLAQFTQTHTPLEYGIYDALSRVGWAIALCYIIFACVNNYGGPINWFLGHPLWQPVSRLCYSIYIVHFSVIMVLMGTIKTPAFFSELTAFHFFIGNFILSIFVALIASLAFESPMIVIEKLIFGPRKRPQTRSAPPPNGTTNPQN